MSEALQLTVFTSSVTLVSVLMSVFYLRVTKSLDDSSLLSRLRIPSFLMPVATLLGTLAFIFAVAKLGQEAAMMPFLFTVSILGAQLVMSVATFFASTTRKTALASLEFRVLAAVTSFILMVVGAVARFIFALLRLTSQADRRRKPEYGEAGNRGPFGYHGYLSYEEKAKRDFGQRF